MTSALTEAFCSQSLTLVIKHRLKSITDTQKHFVNWLVKKECSRVNKQKPLPSQQVGVKLTEDNPNKFKNISGW